MIKLIKKGPGDPNSNSLVISGFLNGGALVFPDMPQDGSYNNKPKYSATPGSTPTCFYNDEPSDLFTPDTPANHWLLFSSPWTWISTSNAATPDLVPAGAWHATTNPHGWRPATGSSGTPVAKIGVIGTFIGQRYLKNSGEWYSWDGSTWVEDVAGATVDSVTLAALATSDPTGFKAVLTSLGVILNA